MDGLAIPGRNFASPARPLSCSAGCRWATFDLGGAGRNLRTSDGQPCNSKSGTTSANARSQYAWHTHNINIFLATPERHNNFEDNSRAQTRRRLFASTVVANQSRVRLCTHWCAPQRGTAASTSSPTSGGREQPVASLSNSCRVLAI